MSDTHPSGPQSLADVANYFLDTRDDLLEEGEVIERDMDEVTAMQVVRREFVSGTCQAFAVALSEHLDLPIVRVAAGLHMAVQRPDGQLIDFTGLATPAQMDRRYGARGRQVHAISREEALESFLMEPMDEAERDPWSDISLARWVRRALDVWPLVMAQSPGQGDEPAGVKDVAGLHAPVCDVVPSSPAQARSGRARRSRCT